MATIGSDEATFVQADGSAPTTVINSGGSEVFYGDKTVTTTEEEYEGSLEAGESVTLTDGKWFISAGSTTIVEKKAEGGVDEVQDAIASLNASIAALDARVTDLEEA